MDACSDRSSSDDDDGTSSSTSSHDVANAAAFCWSAFPEMETSLQTEADGDQVLPGAGIQSMHCDSASEPESRPRCSSRSRSPSPSRGGVGVSAWVHSDDDSVSHASMPAPGLEALSHSHAWVHSDDDTSSADSCADADATAGPVTRVSTLLSKQPQVAPPPAEVNQRAQVHAPPQPKTTA